MKIENYLKVVTAITKLAKQCYEYSVYLDVPNSEDEFSFIINSQSFIVFKVITARTSVIELSKLYGKKGNKYNFKSFLNSLVNGEYGKEFKQNLELMQWIITIENANSTINRVTALRDKAFAHTDLECEIVALQKVGYKDIEKLIELSETLLSFINSKFFNRNFAINTDKNELINNIRLILTAQSS